MLDAVVAHRRVQLGRHDVPRWQLTLRLAGDGSVVGKGGSPKKARSSRKRAQTRRTVDLRRQLVGREPGQLWSLVVAAGASPGVRHRWASVGHLVYAVASIDANGTRPVTAGHLARLLRACMNDNSNLSTLEDFLPADPRERVVVRLGEDVVRLFPGSVERPVADVDRALLVADAVDQSLVSRLGFGVRHLLEVALRYSDQAIQVMAPSWPEGDLPGSGTVVFTAREVAAAGDLVARGTPRNLSDRPELARALEWVTCEAADLPYVPGDPQSQFGRFLRVRRAGSQGHADWLPLAFLPEIMGAGVSQLAGLAADSAETTHRFAQLAAAQGRHALWRFSSCLLGPADNTEGPAVTPSNVVQWVVEFGPNRALLVQLVAALYVDGLQLTGTPAALAVVQAATANPAEPIRVPMAGQILQLEPGTEVVPLLVVATPAHIAARRRPGMMAMSLDDLRWMAASAEADIDLFTFCRDMARPDLPDYFGWEAIDTWEWWRANGKIFFGGGQAPTFVLVEPHGGQAEWSRAAELAEVEDALATLRLPPLRDIDGVDRSSSGPPTVYQWSVQSGGSGQVASATLSDPAGAAIEDKS